MDIIDRKTYESCKIVEEKYIKEVARGVIMEQNKEEFPILIVMMTYVIILLMYIFTYSQKSYLLWGFFIVERLMAIHYDMDIDQYLSNIEDENLSGFKMIVIGVFSLLSVGIFIYTPFKYPKLFVILIIGEVIDFIGRKVKKKIKLM